MPSSSSSSCLPIDMVIPDSLAFGILYCLLPDSLGMGLSASFLHCVCVGDCDKCGATAVATAD
ncbi:MAG: hypothetical protein M3162_06095 [Thermoproteota archaeon]|nr:hypothetical protein [Thermoproteota archaeon]